MGADSSIVPSVRISCPLPRCQAVWCARSTSPVIADHLHPVWSWNGWREGAAGPGLDAFGDFSRRSMWARSAPSQGLKGTRRDAFRGCGCLCQQQGMSASRGSLRREQPLTASALMDGFFVDSGGQWTPAVEDNLCLVLTILLRCHPWPTSADAAERGPADDVQCAERAPPDHGQRASPLD